MNYKTGSLGHCEEGMGEGGAWLELHNPQGQCEVLR